MNANTALKINDVVAEAVNNGETIYAIIEQARTAAYRAEAVKAAEAAKKAHERLNEHLADRSRRGT